MRRELREARLRLKGRAMSKGPVAFLWPCLSAALAASPAQAGYAGLPAGAALFLLGFVIIGLALAWTAVGVSRLFGMLLARLRRK